MLSNKYAEVHLIQSFGPSSLNHDEHGSIKMAQQGGYLRGRVSSQAWKRPTREYMRARQIPDHQSLSTRRMVELTSKRLVDLGRDEVAARGRVAFALAGIDLVTDKKERTEYLIFVSHAALDKIAGLVHGHWDELAPADEFMEEYRGKSLPKKVVNELLDSAFLKALEATFADEVAPEIALFGRHLADIPRGMTDGACQVAHALSTHELQLEIDYFTAVEDAPLEDEMGAGTINETEFSSLCLYRYAAVNLEQLLKNLKGDVNLAAESASLFFTGFHDTVPKSKKGSFAHNMEVSLAAFVFHHGTLPLNLANAFVEPVHPRGRGGVIQRSVTALETHMKGLDEYYGTRRQVLKTICGAPPAIKLNYLAENKKRAKNLDNLFDEVADVITWLLGQS